MIIAIKSKTIVFYLVVFSDVKFIIDILIRDIDPIIYKNNITNSNTRYFWSSLQIVTNLISLKYQFK